MMIRHLIVAAIALGLCAFACGKPVIGITVDAGGDDPHDTRLAVSNTYVDAVTSAGGIPLMLPPGLTLEFIPKYVELCDGFLLTGGRDIHPDRYEATTVSEHSKLLNPRREAFDLALINEVLKANKPVLGVCLGSQEINVALGGSMIQDLPTETSSTINHKPGTAEISHEVAITTGSRLNDIVGTTTLMVNSIHHQACDRMGKGILVTAKAPDGVVESYEVEGYDFALAVQWHPEALTERPEQLRIYEALVKAAERSSRARLGTN